MKNKKRYNTKKRKTERLKWQVLGIAVLISASGIFIHGNMVATEIVLAQEVQYINPVPKVSKMEDLSLKQHVWKLLTEEGGLTFDEAMEAMAIIKCESNWNKMAIGVNRQGLGMDLGLWQINTKYHEGKISREEMFDVYASTRYAIELYKSWGNWNAWVCNK